MRFQLHSKKLIFSVFPLLQKEKRAMPMQATETKSNVLLVFAAALKTLMWGCDPTVDWALPVFSWPRCQKNAVRDLRSTRARKEGVQGWLQRIDGGMSQTTQTASCAALQVRACCAQHKIPEQDHPRGTGKGDSQELEVAQQWRQSRAVVGPRAEPSSDRTKQEAGEHLIEESSLKYLFTEYI